MLQCRNKSMVAMNVMVYSTNKNMVAMNVMLYGTNKSMVATNVLHMYCTNRRWGCPKLWHACCA